MTVAPVCPALNSAAASPAATGSAATRIDAPRLAPQRRRRRLGHRRSTSGASMTRTSSRDRRPGAGCELARRIARPRGPTSIDAADRSDAQRREGAVDDAARAHDRRPSRRRLSRSCRECTHGAGQHRRWSCVASLRRPPAPGARGSSRSSRTRGAAASARGNAGTRRGPSASARRACGASACASWSVFVLD